MPGDEISDFIVARVQRTLENKPDITISDNISWIFSVACFKTRIGFKFEAESGGEMVGWLFGVATVVLQMVKPEVFPIVRLFTVSKIWIKLKIEEIWAKKKV